MRTRRSRDYIAKGCGGCVANGAVDQRERVENMDELILSQIVEACNQRLEPRGRRFVICSATQGRGDPADRAKGGRVARWLRDREARDHSGANVRIDAAANEIV